ncbi:MAG: hypothetical protein ABI923_14285 [bacterium]
MGIRITREELSVGRFEFAGVSEAPMPSNVCCVSPSRRIGTPLLDRDRNAPDLAAALQDCPPSPAPRAAANPL